jgi:hypothetical protein
MLVPDFLPQKGFGYLGGQWGTFKTFVTNDLAVAIGSGGKFAGRQVAFRGAVIQIELEGSNSEARVGAAALARKCAGDALPIIHLKVEPPAIMINGRANPAFSPWTKQLAEYAKKLASYYEVPLALITIDPQNRIAGFKDEQSSSEGQIVANALWRLSHLADCAVMVVDHLGKDPSAGLRGTSAKETNPLFILTTGETVKDVYAKRVLEIRKMRNGETGLGIPFWMEDCSISIEQLNEDGEIAMSTVKTLAIRWGDELHPTGQGGGEDEFSGLQRRAMGVLVDLINKHGEALPAGCEAPGGVRGVPVDSWRKKLASKQVIEGKNVAAQFTKLRNGLLDHKMIDIDNGYVWVPV